MREARGFAVVKLSTTSTHMPTLYNGYLNKIGVVVRGAKAQHHENKIKKEEGPNWGKYERDANYQSNKHLAFKLESGNI